MLMDALQYVDVPGYAALILRRTFGELSQPSGLIPRSQDWLQGKGAVWNENKSQWTFPSGAKLVFGHMQYEVDKYAYQSAEFQYIGFEELTTFTESQYVYMLSRTRRLEGSRLPIRVRSTSNPGGIGHDWVKGRFIVDIPPNTVHTVEEQIDDVLMVRTRRFIPSLVHDNPSLDRTEYVRSLAGLDSVTRAQLLEGNWDVLPEGNRFKREWFGTALPDRPSFLAQWVRYWDKAGTEGGGDWSAGVLMGRAGALFYVLDVVRGRWTPAQRNAIMLQTTRQDALVCPAYSVWAEQEPGSGGKESALTTIQDLAGFDVHAEPVTGSKIIRANPFAAQCEVGNVKLVFGGWNAEYLIELCAFTGDDKIDVHDDQVDGSSGAFAKLTTVQHEVRSVKYA